MGATFEVRARKLEQFFFAHGVDFLSYSKDPEDGMTIWVYEKNEETVRILEEYKLALRRRQLQKGA